MYYINNLWCVCLDAYAKVIGEEKVAMVEVAGGSPKKYISQWHAHGVKVSLSLSLYIYIYMHVYMYQALSIKVILSYSYVYIYQVLHKSATIRHALKAQAAGVDLIEVVGYEASIAGGQPGGH